MSRVLILTDSLAAATGLLTMKLKAAIAACCDESVTIEAIAAVDWVQGADESIFCPLTLSLPDALPFRGRLAYAACADVDAMRRWVETLDYATGGGDLWLPIALTAKGPLYGEVIGCGETPKTYVQPIHFGDEIRQPLYYLAHQVLEKVKAIPSVYLLQFQVDDRGVIFDRLYPFPLDCAIASLGVQTPDLLTCHWLCLTEQPILDLVIKSY
jgi:hypothetical protein